MDKKIKYNVEKFYYDNYRVTTKERDGYPKGEHGLKLYQHKDDEGNYVYVNDDGEYVKSHLEALNIYENNNGRLEGGRQEDPIYNDENARRQIYTLGCSWTYGWDLKQTQTFAHLLGDENTAIHNYGGGGTGSNSSTTATPGTANTGGGGGGGSGSPGPSEGGSGGSGIVIIRYKYK